MAISNFQLVQDALGLLGVLSETETATAEQSTHGLRILNEMMADWREDRVDLQYYEQSATSDTTPIPAHAVAAVKHSLAISLAPYYDRPVPQWLAVLGDKYYARLKRDGIVTELREVDLSHLPLGEARGNFDINSG